MPPESDVCSTFWTGFWSGAGGALIGSLGAALVAIAVVVRTRRNERELMREQMSVEAAQACHKSLLQWTREVDQIRHDFDGDARTLFPLRERLADWADSAYSYGSTIRPARLSWDLRDLWESLVDTYRPALDRPYDERGATQRDEVLRDMGQHLTNVSGEVEAYLRSEWDRRRFVRARRWWRRYRLVRAFPFVKRNSLADILKQYEKDPESGRPPRDY